MFALSPLFSRLFPKSSKAHDSPNPNLLSLEPAADSIPIFSNVWPLKTFRKRLNKWKTSHQRL